MYQEALEIRRRLATANPEVYEPDVSAALNNLAGLYSDMQRFAESEAMYQEALEIRRRLATANPEIYEPDVATTLYNLAILYKKTQRFAESEAMYQEALEIFRRLSKANPEVYEPKVAAALNNLAGLYSDMQRFSESESMYQETLEIRRRLATANPEVYEPNVADTLYNLAILYKETQRFAESKSMCLEALDIYNHLTKEYPQYRPKMNSTLNFLRNMYEEIRQSSTNKNRRRSYIRIFWQWITRKNGPDVAAAFCDLADIYQKNQNFSYAESMYEGALEIYRHLAKENPQVYEIYVTCMQSNLEMLHEKNKMLPS